MVRKRCGDSARLRPERASRPRRPTRAELERTVADARARISCFRSTTARCSVRRCCGAARRGALNMHGSLLPKFRGRAPVNWAILKGDARDAARRCTTWSSAPMPGDIVDQLAVPILEDDDAREVFAKVTVAAETILARSLPRLIAGTAPRRAAAARARAVLRAAPPGGRPHRLAPPGAADPQPGARRGAAVSGRLRAGGRASAGRSTARASAVRARPPAARRGCIGERASALAVCGDGALLRLLEVAARRGPLDLRALAATLRAHRWRSGEPVALDRTQDRRRHLPRHARGRAAARGSAASGSACVRRSSSASDRITPVARSSAPSAAGSSAR